MDSQTDNRLDDGELRKAFGSFTTGVTVVATREADGTPRGFTANSFSSVSLDPPLLLVCIAKSALSLRVFQEAPCFSVNILEQSQAEVSRIFASQAVDKFDRVPWDKGVSEIPLLRGSLARFICETDRQIDAGDHAILLGKVVGFDYQNGTPLSYFRGKYGTLNMFVDGGKTQQYSRIKPAVAAGR